MSFHCLPARFNRLKIRDYQQGQAEADIQGVQLHTHFFALSLRNDQVLSKELDLGSKLHTKILMVFAVLDPVTLCKLKKFPISKIVFT